MEDERRSTTDYASRLENAVERVLGGFAGSLVGLDGITLASYCAEENYDSSLVDAEIATLLGMGSRISGEMAVGGLEEIILSAESATVVARTVGEGFYVSLILNGPHQNLGLARVELRRLSREFVKTLYPEP